MGKINALVVGSGGREATLAESLTKSAIVDKVYVGPGNGGTHEYATPVDLKPDYGNHCRDFLGFLQEENIGLVVSGSETDLVSGLGDIVRMRGIPFMGVGGAAALFEGSKVFSTLFRDALGIPQAHAEVFAADDYEKNIRDAREYGRARFTAGTSGLVPKFDGLAGGKGAIVCRDFDAYGQALLEIVKISGNKPRLVIEDIFLGVEASVTVLVGDDGYQLLSYAQDYKPMGDGDTGKNTGGMGAVTFDLSTSIDARIRREIIEQTIEGARSIRRPLSGGVLYVGLMIAPGGQPYVLEYNARYGDPETQVVIPRIDGDIGEILLAHAKGEVKDIRIRDEHFATVVLAAVGYPDDYSASTGKPILGIDEARQVPGAWVNIAGTAYDGSNGYTVKGSRNLNVCGRGEDPAAAIDTAYRAVTKIQSAGLFSRTDIGRNLGKIHALG